MTLDVSDRQYGRMVIVRGLASGLDQMSGPVIRIGSIGKPIDKTVEIQ